MSKHQPAEQKIQIMKDKRDAKVRDHLMQYAPVWLTADEAILEEDALQFEVVFYHPRYGWVQRRYRFDSYNNVLYHKGQVLVDENGIYDLHSQDPYLTADVLNTVNSYGG
jgi:hypothetical protein